MTPDARQPALAAGYAHAGLQLEQLWVRYFALGGTADLVEVDAYLNGLASVPGDQHDLLAHAVNERLEELVTRHRVPYTRTIRSGRPTAGPLAAVVTLLEVAGAVPPERLPALVAAAGRMLGVDVAVHRIDHEQRCLVRLGPPVAGERDRLGVDSTMAGRAFRAVQVVSSDREGRPRLWVPVLDGADRLGVLEVGVEDEAALYDPALRDQCRWLASLLGHVLASTEAYGDELERPRRTRSMSPAAELVWQQLPPLTAATESFVLAGRLEPSYDVGGDAFDYALSERTVSLGIFDAMGHGMHAGLMAAAALAGYRSARRDGRGVFDQAGAIDDVVSRCFPRSEFVTGVIGEVDLESGRLRYINAGHPAPLLLRGGRVVKELEGGRRVPFGLETASLTVGEEMLQPGDWLALHTDGITEARDSGGTWFGERRLGEFLTRAIGAGQPPAETVRRLTAAVLEHQAGLLQDDATVLLARWKQP
ncbi:PP2C family protein-serine/threonine phosphatase [Blastococcus sp. SYSU DS0541]